MLLPCSIALALSGCLVLAATRPAAAGQGWFAAVGDNHVITTNVAEEAVADGAGNVYAAGQVYQNGTLNIDIVKYDQFGETQWSSLTPIHAGNDNDQHGRPLLRAAISRDTGDGTLVTGATFIGDDQLVLTKYDPDGTKVFAETVTLPNAGAPSGAASASIFKGILTDAATGDFVVYGYANFTSDEQRGCKFFATRYDENGNQLWSTSVPTQANSGTNGGSVSTGAFDKKGDVVLVGQDQYDRMVFLRLDSATGSKRTQLTLEFTVNNINYSYSSVKCLAIDANNNDYIGGTVDDGTTGAMAIEKIAGGTEPGFIAVINPNVSPVFGQIGGIVADGASGVYAAGVGYSGSGQPYRVILQVPANQSGLGTANVINSSVIKSAVTEQIKALYRNPSSGDLFINEEITINTQKSDFNGNEIISSEYDSNGVEKQVQYNIGYANFAGHLALSGSLYDPVGNFLYTLGSYNNHNSNGTRSFVWGVSETELGG